MWIIDRIQELPPLLRYLMYGTVGAVVGFVLHAMWPKREHRQFDAMLLVRYLAFAFIFAGVVYFFAYHGEFLHV